MPAPRHDHSYFAGTVIVKKAHRSDAPLGPANRLTHLNAVVPVGLGRILHSLPLSPHEEVFVVEFPVFYEKRIFRIAVVTGPKNRELVTTGRKRPSRICNMD